MPMESREVLQARHEANEADIVRLEQAAFVRPEDIDMDSARWAILQHFRENDLRRIRQETMR